MNNSISNLIRKQNKINDINLKNLYKKDDYELLLNDVTKVLNENKDCSLTELYNKLYENSKIEQLIKNFFLEKKIAPGAVISFGTKNYEQNIVVGNKQEVILKNGRLVNKPIKMEYDTIFDLASETKLFTSIAITQLLSKKELKLEDRVEKYLPEFKNIGKLNIYDLLTFYPLETEKRLDECNSYDEAYEALLTVKTKNISINSKRYNDFSSMVLKYIVEKITNQNFYDYIKENILDVLDMNDTYVTVKDKERCANSNYDGRIFKNGDTLIRTTADLGISSDEKARILGQPEGNLSGHAGLFSTSKDMVKLAHGLINNQLLNEKYFKLMTKNHTGFLYTDKNIHKSTQYYGFLCYTKNPILKNSEIHHSLSSRSFATAGWTGTQLTVDPINNITVCLMSNRTHNRLTYIDDNIKKYFPETHLDKITLPNNYTMINASDYSSLKDIILHKCTLLALEYKILEETINLDLSNNMIHKTKILQK